MATQTQEKTNGQTKLPPDQVAALAKATPRSAGFGQFGLYIKHHMPQLRRIAAKHLDPERVYRILLNSVSKTPNLQTCTNESILRSCLQASELGLEPGGALGEAYLVPYKDQCQLIVGYRGLIALAFRSGFVQSIKSDVVYQGDEFHPPTDPFNPSMHHLATGTDHSPNLITFAYCVIKLKDGGLLYDVMNRADIERIRARSRAGGNGPWVTDFAEMAKKTVTRRALKYAPMSVEMSKALAADEASEGGDEAMLAEFVSIDIEEPEPAPSKTERVKGKVPDAPEDFNPFAEDEEQGSLV